MEEQKIQTEADPPKGVIIFSVLLIVSSLMHISKMVFDRDMYFAYYRYWPLWLVWVRYAFSWLQRILGLTAAVGMLRLKNYGRQIAIVIGCFTILTIYWKHPYEAFYNMTVDLDHKLGFLFAQWGFPQLRFSQFALPGMIVNCLLDVLFSGALVYYLTRPTVKAHFK